MNERAIDLYREALEFAYARIGREHADTAFFQGVVAGRLSELIVLECAAICERNGETYEHSFTSAKARLARATSEHCAVLIKKTFGVEE